ncbi:hypothetical protein DI43_10095 [Geobacillus sp. CAMR12739]|nr:hypothetical protein DI43_10095 [Geobacillus sp. CAMR12739]
MQYPVLLPQKHELLLYMQIDFQLIILLQNLFQSEGHTVHKFSHQRPLVPHLIRTLLQGGVAIK